MKARRQQAGDRSDGHWSTPAANWQLCLAANGMFEFAMEVEKRTVLHVQAMTIGKLEPAVRGGRPGRLNSEATRIQASASTGSGDEARFSLNALLR